MTVTVGKLMSYLSRLDKNLPVYIGDSHVALADPLYGGPFKQTFKKEDWEGGNIFDTLEEGDDFVLIVGD